MSRTCYQRGGKFRGSGGFTLLELILSMTILSLVTLIIGSGFRLGIKAWEKGESETTETQKLRALSGVLSQDLKSAFPYEIKLDDEKTLVFEGTEDSLLFVTSSADYLEGGFKWVRYSYDEGILSVSSGVMPDKKFQDSLNKEPEIIDDELEEVTFEYLGGADDDWKGSWEMGEGLPAAVRIKIHYFQPFTITIPMSDIKDEEGENNAV